VVLEVLAQMMLVTQAVLAVALLLHQLVVLLLLQAEQQIKVMLVALHLLALQLGALVVEVDLVQ
jgi:hypothetical protein